MAGNLLHLFPSCLRYPFSCSPSLSSTPDPRTSELEKEKQALLSFMDNLIPLTDSSKYRWDRSASPCSWNGVFCGPKDEFIMHLRLPGARLIGKIPPNTIGKLSGLRTLSLRFNGLQGPIPSDFSDLTHLTNLILHHNNFSGELPDLKATKLDVLDVSYNHLNGTIPSGLSKLTYLSKLFLNNNSFTGPLPEINADLKEFSASNNRLNTSVPKSLSGFERSAFSGNVYVCGHPYGPCKANYVNISSPPSSPLVANNIKKGAKNKRPLIVGVSVVSALLLLILVCCLRKNVCKQQRRQVPSNKLVMFDDEIYDFGLEDLLKGSADVLGSGIAGTSYKQKVKEKTMTVVVKRLKDVVVDDEEFKTTMAVLGKMKDKNVVPLRGFYNYSKHEKWLVYDYMPVGSLSARLHGSTSSSRTQLNWEDRMRIALSAAKGLLYLHVTEKVVHGNIKSSNILLRQETNIAASISDYGLNILFGESSSFNHHVTGYWAPEVVKTRKVTFESDVYSFGVLLLEILTGKTPNSSKWVESIAREELNSEIFDEELRSHNNIEEMWQFLRIAKDGVSIVPDQRPTMHDMVSMMENILLRPSSDDHSKGYVYTPSTDPQDTPSTITP